MLPTPTPPNSQPLALEGDRIVNHSHSMQAAADAQASPDLLDLKDILSTIKAGALLERLKDYRHTGRPGYPLLAMWRAYIASFVLNLPSTNVLIRRLESSAELRLLCGFSRLPHRTTFNRFITRLADHQDMVDQSLRPLTDQLAGLLPGFGDKVAADSTAVRTHGNPNRKHKSDPEASWTAKTSSRAKGKDGKDWYYGYKLHLVADATYNLPIAGYATTASANDSRELPNLLDYSRKAHHWFRPRYVMADRGYDAQSNHRAVMARGGIPIIAIRKQSRGQLYEGIYTKEGVPVCMGMKPMEYVESSPDRGHLYRCQPEGCHLRSRQGVLYCQDTVWENRQDNPRLFGAVRRGSQEWKDLYGLRQSVERVFKSLKQSRRLESHCVRGLKHIALHCSMSVLVFQATTLVRLRRSGVDGMCWQVRKVA